MTCPKCGAEQTPGGLECQSCGVVYARYRPPADRNAAGVPPAEEGLLQQSPGRLFAIVVAVVILGIAWTTHRRSVREKSDSEAAAEINRKLNDINNAGLRYRERRAKEEAERERAAKQRQFELRQSDLQRIEGLPDEQIVALIEDCEGFREPTRIRLPRSFRRADYDLTLRSFPELGTAVREKLVELVPPVEDFDRAASNAPPDFTVPSDTIEVRLTTTGQFRLRVSEQGHEYAVDLGRRRVDRITNVQTTPSGASISFLWRYDDAEAQSLLHTTEEFHGLADFRHSDTEWTAGNVHVTLHGGQRTTLCAF